MPYYPGRVVRQVFTDVKRSDQIRSRICDAISLAVSVCNGRDELADRVDVQTITIHKWVAGERKPNLQNAVAIEYATKGQIAREEISPQVYGRIGLLEHVGNKIKIHWEVPSLKDWEKLIIEGDPEDYTPLEVL